MYFECTRTHETERSFPGGVSFHSHDHRRVFPPYVTAQGSRDLMTRLSEYYDRKLSYPSDVVDAFAGIVSSCDLTNEYMHNSYEDGRLTHFYGVLIHYDTVAPDTIRISFLEGLHWRVLFPTPEHSAPPSNLFPSWSWAAVKAAQPVDSPGALQPMISAARRPNRMWKDIDVDVHHRTHGVQPISKLHGNDYTDYLPFIDITTWVQRCRLIPVARGMGAIILHGQYIQLPMTTAAFHVGEVHAICTHVSAFLAGSEVRGLLVLETEPGLYRRVELFHVTVPVEDFGLSQQEALQLRAILDGLDENEDLKRERRAKEEEWDGPSRLGKLAGWQRRRMRLV